MNKTEDAAHSEQGDNLALRGFESVNRAISIPPCQLKLTCVYGLLTDREEGNRHMEMLVYVLEKGNKCMRSMNDHLHDNAGD